MCVQIERDTRSLMLAIFIGLLNAPTLAQQRSTPVTVVNSSDTPVPVVLNSSDTPVPVVLKAPILARPPGGTTESGTTDLVFVNIEGIVGTATLAGYEGWIEASSAAFDVVRKIATTGSFQERETAIPRISDMTITKAYDISSPWLFTLATVGSPKLVTIEFVHAASSGGFLEYLTIELQEALVSSYEVDSHGERPMEAISLNFTRLAVKFTPYDNQNRPGSPIVACYDIRLNQEC